MKFGLRTVMLCGLLLALGGCDRLTATSIAKLKKNPRDYEGKQVTIAGRVTARNSLLLAKYFTVNDDSGEISVITKRALPAVGDKIKVRGKLQEAFSIGQEQALVLVEEENSH